MQDGNYSHYPTINNPISPSTHQPQSPSSISLNMLDYGTNKPPFLKFSNKNAPKQKPPTVTTETEPLELTTHVMLKDSQLKSSVKLTQIPKIRIEAMLDYVFNSVPSHPPVQTTGLLDWIQKTIATLLSVPPTTRIFGFFIENPKCPMLFSKLSTLIFRRMVSMWQV